MPRGSDRLSLVPAAAVGLDALLGSRRLQQEDRRQAEDVRQFDLSRRDDRIARINESYFQLEQQAEATGNALIAAGEDPVAASALVRESFLPAAQALEQAASAFGEADLVPKIRFEGLLGRLSGGPSAAQAAAGQARATVAGQAAGAEAATPHIGQEAAQLQAFPGVGAQAGLAIDRGKLGIAREGLAIDRERLEIDRAAALAGQLPDIGDVASARKEFSALSKPFIEVRDAYSRIQATEDTAAGDLSLIFNFMKVLDPGSVVREGEQATASNAAGIPDRIRNTYNRLMTGERLSPEQRADFRKQAGNLYAAQQDQQRKLEIQFHDLAERQGLPAEDVVLDFSRAGGVTPPKPIEDMSAAEADAWVNNLSDEQLRQLLPDQLADLDRILRAPGSSAHGTINLGTGERTPGSGAPADVKARMGQFGMR